MNNLVIQCTSIVKIIQENILKTNHLDHLEPFYSMYVDFNNFWIVNQMDLYTVIYMTLKHTLILFLVGFSEVSRNIILYSTSSEKCYAVFKNYKFWTK